MCIPEKQERNIEISPVELCLGTLEPLSVHSFDPSRVKPLHFVSIDKDLWWKFFQLHFVHILIYSSN